MNENDDKPEGLGDDFLNQFFPSKEAAEEFAASLDEVAVTEAWKEIYKLYTGLLSGGFPRPVANDVIAGYLYRLVLGMGVEGENE